MKPTIKKNLGRLFTSVLVLTLLLAVLPNPVVASDPVSINPILLVDKLSAEQAVAGGEFNVALGIRNISNNPAFNIRLGFKLEGSEDLGPFTLKNTEAANIKQLAGNASQTIFLTFTVKGEAQNKDYNLLVNLTAQNATFQDAAYTATTLTIPVTYDLTKPVLIVKEASLSPEEPNLLDSFTVNLQVWNLSKTTDARNIVLLLDGKDNFEVLEISNKKNLPKLAKDSSQTVTYKLRAKETRADNTVKLKIDFDYLGNQSQSVEETINLPLPSQDVAIGATPWVIINKYTLSAERVLAGNTVTLSLYIENTNQRPVKNVKISLGVIKIEESTAGTTSSTAGGTVFSPVNSSNSFYMEAIPAKTVVTKDIDLYVDPNATAKTYIVPVTIKYEDRKGTTLTSEEMVNIPVTQECKLQTLSVQIPPVGYVGQPAPIMAEFVNVGKVALGNFMVSLEGDFTKENGSYFVGNLDIGSSDFFQGSVIPQAEGTIEGKLVFSYIDNNNQNVREEKPFTMEIQSQPAGMTGKDGEMMGPEGPSKGVPQERGAVSKIKAWGIPLVVILAIVGVLIVLRRRKQKKMNGEFFDE